MNTFIVNAVVSRPVFFQLEVEAADLAEASAKGEALLRANLGLKHVTDFPELIGESEGTFDEIEILDVEATS